MCNLYRMEDKDWVNKWAQDVESMINLMPAYQMNPNEWGPILRNTADGRKQLVHARWGLPAPRWVLEQEARKKADKAEAKGLAVDLEKLVREQLDGGTTNVRKLNLPHWKRWFGVEHRCLVPVTSFAEPDPASKEEGGKTPNAWFARDDSKPLMFFAGIHVPQWTSVRPPRHWRRPS
jgi:putative SOS response-associated peptidase YedK